jgi:periplasmic copper chaperone A
MVSVSLRHALEKSVKVRSWMMLSVLLAAVAPALAQVEVKDAWARPTVSAQKATGAFMRLTATQNSRVVEVTSPVAGIAEIHEMKMSDNNLMQMRPVTALELPAGKTVELKPGGFHVMLQDLKQPIKDGDVVPLTLVVEGADGKRSNVEVKAVAKAMGGMQH